MENRTLLVLLSGRFFNGDCDACQLRRKSFVSYVDSHSQHNCLTHFSVNYFSQDAADFSFTCKKIIRPLDVSLQTTAFPQRIAYREYADESNQRPMFLRDSWSQQN